MGNGYVASADYYDLGEGITTYAPSDVNETFNADATIYPYLVHKQHLYGGAVALLLLGFIIGRYSKNPKLTYYMGYSRNTPCMLQNAFCTKKPPCLHFDRECCKLKSGPTYDLEMCSHCVGVDIKKA